MFGPWCMMRQKKNQTRQSADLNQACAPYHGLQQIQEVASVAVKGRRT